MVLGYFLERWQRWSFVRQLRSEEVRSRGHGSADQSPTGASGRGDSAPWSASEQSLVAAGDQVDAIVDYRDGGGGSSSMLADLLLVGAILPLACAAAWQLLGLCFRT